MNIISKALSKYLSEMKLSSSDKYVYLVRNAVLGDILVSMSNHDGFIKTIRVYDISDSYFNKVYSVDVLNGNTIGKMTDIGILDTFDSIAVYNILYWYNTHMNVLNSIVNDIVTSDNTSYNLQLNADENFYNDVLLKKKSDGAGRYLLGDNVIYLSPSMLPCTKKTDLDAVTYYKTGNSYFTVCFTAHKSCDVNTYMRFMCL